LRHEHSDPSYCFLSIQYVLLVSTNILFSRIATFSCFSITILVYKVGVGHIHSQSNGVAFKKFSSLFQYPFPFKQLQLPHPYCPFTSPPAGIPSRQPCSRNSISGCVSPISSYLNPPFLLLFTFFLLITYTLGATK